MGHGLKALLLTLLLSLRLTTASALPYEIVIGDSTIPGYYGNGFPFQQLQDWMGYPSTRYQQVYAASSFSRPFNIQEIIFYPYSNMDQAISPATYEIYLSVTPYGVNEIDGRPFDDNLGSRTDLFTSFVGGFVISGSEFVIRGNPFLYDPSRGNLLLDIRISGAQYTGAGPYFAALGIDDYEHGLFSRWHDLGTGFDNRGLVTGFRTRVPEPGTLALLGLGLAGLGLSRRRRAN